MARAIVSVSIGDRFNYLTCVSEPWYEVQRSGKRRLVAEFQCRCGDKRTAIVLAVVKGQVLGCGKCRRKRTHGLAGTPIYFRWNAMKARSAPGFTAYGYATVGRDPRWDSFEEFYADMGDSYFPGAALARFGDVGDYTKDNCRWVTRSENARELVDRYAIRLDDGRRAIDVAREHGVKRTTLHNRLVAGWDPWRAATEPPRFNQRWHN